MTSENSDEKQNQASNPQDSGDETTSKTSARSDAINDQGNQTIVVEKSIYREAFGAPETESSPFPVSSGSSSYSQLAAICLYFEKNWTPDRVFTIRDALEHISPAQQRDAFRELVRIDISLGATNGAIIPIQTYKEVFPNWTTEIDEAYKTASLDSVVQRQARIGRKLGNLRLEGIIGKGSMGIVYKAYNEELRRYDAVKYLAPTCGGSNGTIDYIRAELAANGQVNDPRFARAYGSGSDGDFHYLVMEYVDGVDLARYLRNERGDRPKAGPISLEEAAGYVCEVAKGLCSIHKVGIIHRDIKPENIVLDSDRRVRILDLGLARWRANESQMLSTFLQSLLKSRVEKEMDIVGTPAYMSPEGFFNPEQVDEQSDLYSLGGVFFFLTTGKLPIQRYNPRFDSNPRPLKDFFPNEYERGSSTSRKLLSVLEKLLEPGRDKRYKNAREVVDDLERILNKEKNAQSRLVRNLAAIASLVVAAVGIAAFVAPREGKSPVEAPSVEVEPPQTPGQSATNVAFVARPCEGGAEIVGVDDASGALVIPETVPVKGESGKDAEARVVRIGDGAFRDQSSITSISLPRSATHIGVAAFRGCPSLASITLREGLASIGESAFAECDSLASVKLPKSLEFVGENAFPKSTKIVFSFRALPCEGGAEITGFDGNCFGDLVIPQTIAVKDASGKDVETPVVKIGAGAFLDLRCVSSVSFPEDVNQIGSAAFRGCSSLSTVAFPKNLARIGRNAFAGCDSLASIVIPKSVEFIGENAFPESTTIVDERVPDVQPQDDDGVVSNVDVAKDDVARVSSSESIFEVESFNDGLTITGMKDGAGLPNDGALVIPAYIDDKPVLHINDGAFADCAALTSISLPETVTQIGDGAFADCSSLLKIDVDEKNADYRSADGVLFSKDGKTLVAYPVGNAVKDYVVPSGVEKIGGAAFQRSKLESITLPDRLKQIGGHAFYECNSLKTIALPASVEQIGENAFPESTTIVDERVPSAQPSENDVANDDVLRISSSESIFEVEPFNDGLSITGVKEGSVPPADGVLIVPGYIDDKPVLRICDEAFAGDDALKSVSLPETVTQIDDGAFAVCRSYNEFTSCGSLLKIDVDEKNADYRSVGGVLFSKDGKTLVAYPIGNDEEEYVVPNGVEKISDGAFQESKLESITLPLGLKQIGDKAFSACNSLTSINLPADLTEIGDGAFCSCVSLKSVSLPETVTQVGDGAFADCCSLQKIDVDEKNADYRSVDGVLFSKDGKTLVAYPIGNDEKEYAILKGVEKIADGAFYGCCSLMSVSLPAGLTMIGDYAFYGCYSLTSINLPNGLTEIGARAFFMCYSLTSINLPVGLTEIGTGAFANCRSLTSINLPETVTQVGERAFAGCVSLQKIDVDEKNADYRSVGGVLFSKDGKTLVAYSAGNAEKEYVVPNGVEKISGGAFPESRLESITLPKGLKRIDDYAFAGCNSLKSISLPEGLTKIGDWAFAACNSLKSISLPAGLTEIGDDAFVGCAALTSISLPVGLSKIDDHAFEGCAALTSISLPAGLTEIGDHAFEGCAALKSISLPVGLTKIGYKAFANCQSLTSITLPVGLTEIGNGAFAGCAALKSISLPVGLTEIGDHAFVDCYSLTSIGLSKTVTHIGKRAFADCLSLLKIDVDEKNADYRSINGVLFSKDGKTLVAYHAGNAEKEYVVPNEVEKIGDCAFIGSKLESITLPMGLKQIGFHAFNGCKSLKSISLPEGLTEIGGNAFFGCESLTSISLSAGLTNIGDQAFSSCRSLTSINLPETVTQIGDGAFAVCSSLLKIEVDEKNAYYRSVGGVLFSKDGKTLVAYPEGNPEKEYVVPRGVEIIDRGAFNSCKSLTSITLPAGLTEIGDEAFLGCELLTSITLPVELTEIGDGAFANCHALTSINLPAGLTNIGDGAFEGCAALTSISLPVGLTEIGDYAFSACLSLTSINLPADLTEIGDGAFNFCRSLQKIDVDEKSAYYRSVGGVLFSKDGKTLIAYPEGKAEKEKEYVVPNGVEKIRAYAFYSCVSLKSITLPPETVTQIGENTFPATTKVVGNVVMRGIVIEGK